MDRHTADRVFRSTFTAGIMTVLMVVSIPDRVLVHMADSARVHVPVPAVGSARVPEVAEDIDFCTKQNFQKPVDLINRLFLCS
jgi:hypothetical protein